MKIYTTVVQPGFLENIFLHFKASDQLRSTTHKKKKKKDQKNWAEKAQNKILWNYSQ